MLKNNLKQQIQEMSKEFILRLDREQFAGLILQMYRDVKNSFYCQISLSYLLEEYNINYKFNHTPILGGILEERGIPKAIKEKCDKSIIFLQEHKLIKYAEGQSKDSDFFSLTEDGENIRINDNYTLLIKRSPEEFVTMFKSSVFLVTGRNKTDDLANGTCFLFNNEDKILILLTAKHVVEGITSEGNIYLSEDKSIIVHLNDIKIKKSTTSDVAALFLPKTDASDIIRNHTSFKNLTSNCSKGETVISLGYPCIAHLKDIYLTSSTNNISLQNGEEFSGEKLICLNNSLLPGYSGGPLINMKGELLGIVSKNLINSTDSSKADGYKVAAIASLEGIENLLKD